MTDRPTITAFSSAPEVAWGLVRDMRVRWAFEEVGQPYAVRLVDGETVKAAAHRRLQPFGAVPTYQEEGLDLFESGAIVMYIARKYPGLLPDDPVGRIHAEQWVFAAMTSVESTLDDLAKVNVVERDQPWAEHRRPLVEKRVHDRLSDLAARLGDKDYLDGDFTVGDLMMACVLLRLKRFGLLDAYPNLAAYLARCEARPAFRRAFDAQVADFSDQPPIAA
jgi:glutathione S-transferase